MSNIYADGKVEGGKLILYDRDKFASEIPQFEGKPVRLSLSRGNKRSNAQNNYWHGVVVEMFMDAMGYENTKENHDAVHEILKAELNSETTEIINKLTGEVKTITYSKSTANLSTDDFSALKERAQKLGAEFYGIYIPDPNEEPQ